MRITTKMLNESASKAGMPTNGASLVNYLNGDSSDTLFDTLGKSSITDVATKTKYEKLEKTADQLSEATSVFLSSEGDSVFSKTGESEDIQAGYSAVEDFVEKYNDTLSALKNTSGVLNDYYRQILQSTVSDNKEVLESIGVTVAKNGSLSIDTDKLKKMNMDTLESVFGNNSGFAQKVAYVAGRISDSARTNQSSLSSMYTSKGMSYSMLSGKYNLYI